MQHRITVLFPAPLACYDYKADTELPVGTFVMAPFGRKKTLGVVWDKKANLSFDESKVKNKMGIFFNPHVFDVDENDVDEFDKKFEYREKLVLEGQLGD